MAKKESDQGLSAREAQRRKRQAEALRANLKRRKAAMQGVKAAKTDAEPETDG